MRNDNGIPPVTARRSRMEIRAALGLAMDVHVILTVARLAEQKNYRLLIIVR